MARSWWSLVVVALVAACFGRSTEFMVEGKPYSMPFNRNSFPAGFIFGTGSAATQSEGAAFTDGRDLAYGILSPETILKTDQGTPTGADDFYHRYKSDIQLMKRIGLDSFRFSISWSRVLPKGKISGGVNPRGVKFYNNLIDELLANGLIPFVTLFHWDVPQALEDEYGGFRSERIVKDYVDYVDFCFKTFGDRVKHWATLNEPFTFSTNGYNSGTMAPGRCSSYMGNCTAGNSATEPYVVAHNLLLSHAAGVNLYKTKYQAHQKGKIGITLVTNWMVPISNSAADREAALRALDFLFGWFANPITYGDYPKSMRSYVGNRLPKFSPIQSKLLTGSYDFIGINYYTTDYAEYSPSNTLNKSYRTDLHVTLSTSKNGIPIGTPTALDWLFIYPKGIRDLMLYVKDKYKNPAIYMTENGVADNATISREAARKDATRIRYFHSHLSYLLESIKKGVNVQGYYSWSFFDDFEWDAGYTVRFGIIYIDFKNELKRYLKYSAYWWKMFLLN